MSIAVYTNIRGQVVIREEGDWPHDEDDKWILVAPENAIRLARAVLKEVGLEIGELRRVEGRCPVETPDSLAPKPSRGAERQRRYRERHGCNGVTDAKRNASVTSDVTRDGAMAAE